MILTTNPSYRLSKLQQLTQRVGYDVFINANNAQTKKLESTWTYGASKNIAAAVKKRPTNQSLS